MIRRIVAVVLSIGWLLPMWVGLSLLASLALHELEFDPFPDISIALSIAFVWLGAVLAVHAWRLWGKPSGTT